MTRLLFVALLAFFFFGTGCAVILKGETEGDLAVAQAQADAMRAYARQYRPDNLDTAASPFDTSRRTEVQAPAGTSVSISSGSFYRDVEAGEARARR